MKETYKTLKSLGEKTKTIWHSIESISGRISPEFKETHKQAVEKVNRLIREEHLNSVQTPTDLLTLHTSLEREIAVVESLVGMLEKSYEYFLFGKEAAPTVQALLNQASSIYDQATQHRGKANASLSEEMHTLAKAREALENSWKLFLAQISGHSTTVEEASRTKEQIIENTKKIEDLILSTQEALNTHIKKQNC